MGRRYLLDTHVLIWALTEPERLSPRVRALLEDPDTPLLVSSASAWEMATKHRLGKLSGAEAVLEGLEAHLSRLGAEELPIRLAHALLAGRLPGDHRDPFDRILAAQSLVEGLVLLTTDRAFRSFGVETLW
ncbi:PIN domain-containing protein [Thermus thermophilus]|uniref:PIN domain-containing protein n=1 Tax=Thermus thermophilus TaxID=274 RepID=UPI0013FE1665|nr:type II toxin-antitoxin system VapC family toxin [Thermus thermophilus]